MCVASTAATGLTCFIFRFLRRPLVLPVALSLPGGWEVAAVVIVVQSLVELFGMVFYLWWVPRWLFRPAARMAETS